MLLKSNLSTRQKQRAKIRTEAGRLSTLLGDNAKLELDKLGSEVKNFTRIKALNEEIEMYESTNEVNKDKSESMVCNLMTLKQTPSEVPQDIGECKTCQ